LAKPLVGLIKNEFDPIYRANAPSSQYGGVAGGGTDYAHHFLLSALAYAALQSCSIFVLFVDLVKAYDQVLRELVFGFPHGVAGDENAKLDYLQGLGMNEDDARWILRYLETHGSACHQWGVSKEVTEMMNGLHTKAWCSYAESKSFVVTYTGGRQGCKLGGYVFGSAFALALNMLYEQLRAEGILLRLRRTSGAFWGDEANDDDECNAKCPEEEILDAIFIDDTVIVLFGSTPKTLKKAVDVLMRILPVTFARFKLAINWAPNKTEAFFILRGKGATQVRESYRQPDGKLAIPIPNSSDMLRIVTQYKHLGSMTEACGQSVSYATARASTALCAYCPISSRVFGAAKIGYWLKLVFLRSLVMMTLTFNAHVRVLEPSALARLNAVYMRALRRICDDMNFGKSSLTDYDVRIKVGMPSLDCLLQRSRLRYAQRLISSKHVALLTILATRSSSGCRLPWVAQLRNDLDDFYNRVSQVRSILPPPGETTKWMHFMTQSPEEWRALVDSLFYTESVCDRVKTVSHDLALSCEICGLMGPCFATNKQLAQHQRIKHGMTNEVKQHIGKESICMRCKVEFNSRLRLIAHVTDRRRNECKQHYLRNVRALSDAEYRELEEADKAALREARRAGHSHVIAKRPARTACGKQIGRVQN
jgi:hypothetical protein